MERQSKHFVAMPVFSLDDGQQIGLVKEIVIDYRNFEVSALVIEPKGFFKEQKIIPYIKVKNVGSDAITIERTVGATNPTNLPQILSLMKNGNTIIGTKVITETGITLGYIEEFLVEDSTGKIAGFELGSKITGLMGGKTKINAGMSLTLGKDALIVKAGTEQELTQLSPPIKDSFKNLTLEASKWVDSAFDQSKRWVKNVGDKLSKIAAEELPTHFRKKDEAPPETSKKEDEDKDQDNLF